MSNWQPIETMPKDAGTVLMVGCVKYGSLIWIGSSMKRYGNSSGVGAPTHWMPLPDPPVASGEVERDVKSPEGKRLTYARLTA